MAKKTYVMNTIKGYRTSKNAAAILFIGGLTLMCAGYLMHDSVAWDLGERTLWPALFYRIGTKTAEACFEEKSDLEKKLPD